jgi:hypothetical protein
MQRIKELLQQPDTVVFVGSGISCWSGLPTWPQAIGELAEELEQLGIDANLVRTEAARGDLLQAASYGFDQLTKSQIGQFVRKMTRYGHARPHTVHRLLVSFGARCYVTTNYDNLLEEALRTWRSDRFVRPPITNRQLASMADVVHARATDFIFKPHGDAGDSDSIVLTREQYRDLLPGGERNATLETVKMLLATRAVVYVGFGLRDPDFSYVRDLLLNTYKGGTREHYAILPDISAPEAAYWRKHCGIHLIGYSTTLRPDNSRDHSALLALLEQLAKPSAPKNQPVSSGTALRLARHAARLTRVQVVAPELPVRARKQSKGSFQRFDPQTNWKIAVEKLLDFTPKGMVMIGLPGAGKTYAMSQSAKRHAHDLHHLCLEESPDWSRAVVPVLADLKLYEGNLWSLVERTLPLDLPLKELTQTFTTRIYLDSFNEMPRNFLEDGSYEADFRRFLERVGPAFVAIGSRTTDGLLAFDLPVYSLDEIDATYVNAALSRAGVHLTGRFATELERLFQKPFYFQLLIHGQVQLPKEPRPRDLYEAYFSQLSREASHRFHIDLDLQSALQSWAYEALDSGQEARPLETLLHTLQRLCGSIAPSALTNWLISKFVVLPYSGGRVALFHQSVTEFLAASELAHTFVRDRTIVRRKLASRRWDQALLLAASMLPDHESRSFLDFVVAADFPLALRASKYLESEQEEIAAYLLAEILRQTSDSKDFETVSEIARALKRHVPVTANHVGLLRELAGRRNLIGGAAVERLVQLKGAECKPELFSLLAKHPEDYNFCANGVARALQQLADPSDVEEIAETATSLADKVTSEDERGIEPAHGFIAACAIVLRDMDPHAVVNRLVPKDAAVPLINAAIVGRVLKEHKTERALSLAAALLLRDIKYMTVTIYFIGKYPVEQLSWNGFDERHVRKLMEWIALTDFWIVEALSLLCKARADLAKWALDDSQGNSAFVRAVLRYCATGETEPVFSALGSFIATPAQQWNSEPIQLLKSIELDWRGRETLLVALLRLRNVDLAFSILNQLGALRRDVGLSDLDIGPVEWWMEWLSELDASAYWMEKRLAELFSKHLPASTRRAFLNEFNKPDSPYRDVLARSILVEQSGFTTDDLSETGLDFLLAQLSRDRFAGFDGHFLGKWATESFCENQLVPLLEQTSDKTTAKNLQRILRDAGRRHGRRYLVG